MIKQHYSSLRNILTANFVLVAALPIVFIGLTGLYVLTSNMQQEIAKKNLLLAQSVASEVERFLKEPLRVLTQIEYIINRKELLPETMTSYLESILMNYTFFDTLMITDRQGTVRYLAPYREDFLHISMSGHIAFRAALDSKQPHWSPTFISLQTNQPTIIISFPVTHGMIIGYLNLAALKAIIEKVTIGKYGYAAIIDQNGTIIAHPKQAYTSQRLNVQNIPLIRQGLRGYEGTAGYRFEGVEKLGSVARISSIHWIVVIAQTKKEAYASITKITILFWSGMGAAIIFAFFSAMFIFQKTLKPLVQLTNSSQKIAEGEYEILTWHKGYREIEKLTRSFNMMVGAIESREQALLQREEQYRVLFNSINDALFVNSIVDEELGPFIEVNSVACQRLGYTHEELLQCAPSDISEPANIHMSRLAVKIVTKRHILFEHILICKDGQQFPVEINAHLFELNGQTVILSTARDISERKHAEEAMHRLRNLLSNTIDSMPSILVGVTKDGTVIQWNRKAEEETGITADEAFGQQFTDIFPQLAGKMSTLGLALRKQHLHHDEKVVWKHGNTTRFVDITIYPLLEADMEGAVIRIDDVTERVRMEEIMLQSEKMLMVSGLSAGMAHEINNPLGIIVQSMQNMARRLSPDSAKNQQVAQECGVSLKQILAYFERQHILHYVNGAQEAGQRASKIVSNMLSFSRKGELDKTPIDINQLLDESIGLAMSDYALKKKYHAKQIEILREYDPTLPVISCIRLEIEQVFLNVLKNAVQAFPGTPHTSRKPSIRIYTMRDDRSLIIRIEDNGIGMDAHTRKRVFEPFYTTKPVGEGTGLGLSVSYFIIETHHGGEISIDSEPDNGTILTIHLPL